MNKKVKYPKWERKYGLRNVGCPHSTLFRAYCLEGTDRLYPRFVISIYDLGGAFFVVSSIKRESKGFWNDHPIPKYMYSEVIELINEYSILKGESDE